ncbi:hydrogenase maturation protease [Amycolatopsis sp. K13G38]|uniref:Hydrogenase maturation protease n=1 Tax=Amycolatopsis acididurans TaxID=2724524 RepID=A0ABX1JHD4_9PSEU|nr:hydrogenase maturation protease [Amycolatopsis acididurans]NKQ58239.1 hydrogenase maturation protease [Amycolatopsis acididurans]
MAGAIADRRRPGVRVVFSDGEPVALLEAWSDADLAVVLDAVMCDPPVPGRIRRSTMDTLPGATAVAGSHSFGIAEALRLGHVLRRVPRRLLVVAVEAANFELGVGLSPPVAAAVPAVVVSVLREISPRCGVDSDR